MSRRHRMRRIESFPGLLSLSLAVFVVATLGGCGGGGDLPSGGQEPGTFRIEGRVVDGNGNAVDAATVSLSGATSGSTAVDADGRFEFAATVGDHDLDVVVAGFTVRELELSVDGTENVDLGPVTSLVTARGRAVDGDGSGLADVLVELDGLLDSTFVTDADGVFEAQLAAGPHAFTASWEGVEAVAFDFDAALGAVADLGDVTVLQTLRGRVLDGLLDPIEDAKVIVEAEPTVVLVTDDDGRFTTQLRAGVHRVQIVRDGMTLFDDDVAVQGDLAADLGDMQLLVRVAGRLVDEIDVPNTDPPTTVQVPVAGAEVSIDTTPPISTTSASDGRFEVEVPLDVHQVCVLLDGVFVAHDLLDASVASPTVLVLPDIVATPMPDVDGDTLGNSLETDGWMILVDEIGQGLPSLRHVTSSPFASDSDGDTLTDVEEFGFRTDPSRPDTDGDLLTDVVELRQYVSNPVLVDSDGDALPLEDGVPDSTATPTSVMFDGNEAMVLLTSPTLDDTDGDGFRDRKEVLEGGTNARVADLPKISIEVFGEPVVGFEGDVTLSEELTQSSVANDTSSSRKTKEFNFKTEGSVDVEVKATAKAGFPGGFGGGVESTATLRAGLNTDYAYHTDSESAESMQNVVEATASQLSEFTAGKIEAAIVVQNESDLAVRYDNLHIIVFRIDPTLGPAGLKPIGELFEPDGTVGSESVLLGPQGTQTLLRENKDLDILRVRDYLANPTGLYFRIGDYRMFLVDELGNTVVDYDVVAQNVVERTAQLSIDWGDGTSEDYLVATNVERNPDGTPAGLRMADALASLGYDFDTAPGEDPEGFEYGNFPSREGVQLVTRIDTVANVQEFSEAGDPINSASRFWFVYGPGVTEPVFVDPTTGSPLPQPGEDLVDFGEIRLMPGDAYLLQFQTDEDTDGLSRQQEDVYGTSDLNEDSDGDGVTDFDEIVVGWTVEFEDDDTACEFSDAQVAALAYKVHPNARFRDIDRDGLTDDEEKSKTTDPFRRDTDFDGILDGDDDTNDACTFADALSDDAVVHISFDIEDWDASQRSFTDLSSSGNMLFLRTSTEIVEKLFPYAGSSSPGPDKTLNGGIEWYHAVSDDPAPLPFGNCGGHPFGDSIGEASVFLWNERQRSLGPTEAPLPNKCATEVRPDPGPNFELLRDENAPVEAPHFTADAENRGWTLALWISPRHGGVITTSTGQALGQPSVFEWSPDAPDVANVVAAQADHFEFGLVNHRLTAEFETDDGAVAILGPELEPYVYVHVAITSDYDGETDTTTFTLFAEGVPVGTSSIEGPHTNPSPPGDAGGNVSIGSRGPYSDDFPSSNLEYPQGYVSEMGPGQRYNGAMDDLRVYDRPLTTDEILELALEQP